MSLKKGRCFAILKMFCGQKKPDDKNLDYPLGSQQKKTA